MICDIPICFKKFAQKGSKKIKIISMKFKR